MEFSLLGWPENGPRLRLDYRRFAYARKFVTAAMSKTVLRDPDDSLPPLDDNQPAPTSSPGSLPPLVEDVVAAIAFNEDRTDPTTPWLRYVTVRWDHRDDGLSPDLPRRTCDTADRGYETIRIAADNPFAYKACHKAGSGFTSRETGVAELVPERPVDAPVAVSHEAYQSDFDRYHARDLNDPERTLLAARERVEPPEIGTGHSDD